ncbi:MAG TPA: hypothetical protein VFF79_17145 [Conexibacter sp.]|nr:hypothetical protein [Conexibacter sp.]
MAPSAAQRHHRAARSWNQPSRRSRSRVIGLLAVGLVLALSATGCGSSASRPAPTATELSSAAGGSFAALSPAAPPAGWRSARLPSGAVLAYPAGWRRIRGDRGTASAALLDAHGRYLAYLNLTPRQGREQLATFAAFRVAHNRAEGDADVVAQASAHGLGFRDGGRGTCVRDAYTTATSLRFVEVACLVSGPRTSSVIVAAAPPGQWAKQWPVLRRALAAVGT